MRPGGSWAAARSSCITSRCRPSPFPGSPRPSASTTWPRAPASCTRSRSAPRRRASGSWTGPCTRCWPRSRCTGSTISSARRRPRTCMCCGSPTACSPACGIASTSSRCRSTCPTARHHGPLGVLRRHRRGARHARHAPVPGGRGGRDGAAGEPGGGRPAGGPREGHPHIPAAGPGRGRARAVRRLSGCARRGGAVEAEHLCRRPAVDRQPALAGRAVLPSHRQAARRLAAAGQPHPPQAWRSAGGAAARRLQRAVVLPGRGRRDRPLAGREEARRRARPRIRRRPPSPCPG